MALTKTERELQDEKFRGVYSRLDSYNEVVQIELKEIKELLKATHEQAKLTNGRVNRLELWKENLKGKITVITLIASTVVGIIIKIIFK